MSKSEKEQRERLKVLQGSAEEQPRLVRFGRLVLFCLLVVMEIVVAVSSLSKWMIVVPAIAVLTVENAVKM